MIFSETKLQGAFVIDIAPVEDSRGFFARTWCQEEMARMGLQSSLMQCNVSFNHKRGTLRGLHYQAAPYEECKIVRCTQGAIYDVIVDLRPDSPTFMQWIGHELTAANRRMLYVPEGCAHGFQTLVDETEVFYQMSQVHHPESARGVRWNDSAFAVQWPIAQPIMNQRDATYPLWRE